jgi:hypothetical protein
VHEDDRAQQDGQQRYGGDPGVEAGDQQQRAADFRRDREIGEGGRQPERREERGRAGRREGLRLSV